MSSVSQSSNANWLELLVSGLTFDLVGLDPGDPAPVLPHRHVYALPPEFTCTGMEAVTAQPGPHLAGGARMLPVIRSQAWLAAKLCELPGVQAVVWHAAGACSAPWHFRDAVLEWIGGGAFPGLGLCALIPGNDASMQSEGLSLFTGQELRIMPGVAPDRAQAAKVAVRLLHWLVEHGHLDNAEIITGPDGESLRLDPLEDSRIVEVWRN